MSSLHNIHSCSQILAQNAELKQKLHYVKRKKDEVQRQLDSLLTRDQKTQPKLATKHVAIQTELKPWTLRSVSQLTKPPDKQLQESDLSKINKLMDMHSQLLKRYDKEVKLNMSYADTISELNIKLAEADKHLREAREKTLNLERELILSKAKSAKPECEDHVLRDVLKERNKLMKENKRLKGELKGLDQNFFDEIEDLKFALLQSSKINEEYKNTLAKMCLQFGLPFPPSDNYLAKNPTVTMIK
ncbi:uncharacterized protein LOC131942847 [Physella acuta]|uniref:uncharacterized protein LOC131942847 n=1 Tax=Physella acuta TaxID=109671 RepID=UPI0027DAE038|nr:uncharacterized protein LOC131942847 [Physella acuta]